MVSPHGFQQLTNKSWPVAPLLGVSFGMKLADLLNMRFLIFVVFLCLWLIGCSGAPGEPGGSQAGPVLSPVGGEIGGENGDPSGPLTEGAGLTGTGDGSGGDPRRSSFEDVDSVLLNPSDPKFDFRRRLRIAFHRLNFIINPPEVSPFDRGNIDELIFNDLSSWGRSSNTPRIYSYPNDHAVRPLLNKVLSSGTDKTLDETILEMEIVIQEKACVTDPDDEGRSFKRAMAAKGNRLCVSRELLATISPEDLYIQTLALGTHEVSHMRGIESEEEAEMIQGFVTYHADFLFGQITNDRFSTLQESLGKLLSENLMNHKELAKLSSGFDPAREFMFSRCKLLYRALSDQANIDSMALRFLVRSPIENLITRFCMNMNPASLQREQIGDITRDRGLHVKFLGEVSDILKTIEELRLHFMAVASPFYSDLNLTLARIGEKELIGSATRPLIDDSGTWQPSLNRELGGELIKDLKCSLNSEVLEEWEKCTKDPYDLDYESDRCILINLSDDKGNSHRVEIRKGHPVVSAFFPFFPGPTSTIYDLVKIQVRVMEEMPARPESGIKESYLAPTKMKRFRVNGSEDLLGNIGFFTKPTSNFLPIYETGASNVIIGVLKSETTPSFEVSFSLANGYDEDSEKPVFDEKKSKLRCELIYEN